MTLKEEVEKAIKNFFQKERPKILKSIKKRLRDHSVLVCFKGIDGYSVWRGEGLVDITEAEIVDGLYCIVICYSGNIHIEEKKDEKSKQEVREEKLRQRIACLLGGEKQETAFYEDLFKKEIQEILKGFLYTKAADLAFLISTKSK
jgi:hypothetical protein